MGLFSEILERVEYYKKLGLNPLSLATGCAVKVDLLRVVYPAIHKLKPQLEGTRLTIASREDADVFPRSENGVSLCRRIYGLGEDAKVDPDDIRKISPFRAVVVVQVYQPYVDEPEKFVDLIAPIYLGIASSGVPLYLGKGHSIITPFIEDQFALFDFIKINEGRVEGFTAVNNDTIHIIDPSEEPGEYRQVFGAISNSLNDIFVLGVYENLRVAPVINAISEELRAKIWKNAVSFGKKYGVEIIETPQPKRGKLLIGATVFGDTFKRPPMFADEVRVRMKLIATRPMGELAPINVYLSSIVDETIIEDLEEMGISFEELEKMKDKAVNTIATPNIEAARVINKYLPDYGECYNPSEHIALTTDVTGPGIYVVKELAEKLNTVIRIDEVPLLFPKAAELATRLYIIPNATAGTNGAFILVAPETVAEDIVKDLRSKGLAASIMGEVVEKGRVEVEAPKTLRKYVTDQRLLKEFKLIGG